MNLAKNMLICDSKEGKCISDEYGTIQECEQKHKQTKCVTRHRSRSLKAFIQVTAYQYIYIYILSSYTRLYLSSFSYFTKFERIKPKTR